MWRNWQTRTVESRISCEFESHHEHHRLVAQRQRHRVQRAVSDRFESVRAYQRFASVKGMGIPSFLKVGVSRFEAERSHQVSRRDANRQTCSPQNRVPKGSTPFAGTIKINWLTFSKKAIALFRSYDRLNIVSSSNLLSCTKPRPNDTSHPFRRQNTKRYAARTAARQFGGYPHAHGDLSLSHRN